MLAVMIFIYVIKADIQEKSRQFFYDENSGVVVSIVRNVQDNSFHVVRYRWVAGHNVYSMNSNMSSVAEYFYTTNSLVPLNPMLFTFYIFGQ